MLGKLNKRKEGFTIIEVLIVLAIAGLMMLVVLLAVPALQRNSRNTRVKNDASKAGSLLQETINNNDGTAVAGTTAPNVLATANAKYSQVSSLDYNVSTSAFQALPGTLVKDSIVIRNWSTCAAGGNGRLGVTGGTERQYTLTYLVESPGAPATAPAPAGYTAQCVES